MSSTWKPWTNLELWTLLTMYKSDMDEGWDIRVAEQMEATRSSRVEKRPRGFYTADKCKQQLAKIMAEPCPSEVPTGTEYSRTAIVDEWIKHYSEQERQDAAVYGQFMNVKIRSYEERLMAAWGHREKFTTEELEAMLEGIKKEEKEMRIWSATQTCQDLHEVEYDDEEAEKHERMGAIYYKHLADLFYKQKDSNLSQSHVTNRHSSTPSEQKLNDVNMEKQSPDGSDRKSPVTNSFPEVEAMHVLKSESDQEEKMDVDDLGLTLDVSSSANLPAKNLSQDDHCSRRPRGRPPKKDSSTPTREASPLTTNHSEEAKSPTRSETLRSSCRSELTATPFTMEKDAIHVVDSPAGRVRGARRPAPVDSPLLSKSSTPSRTSTGAEVKDVKEGSKERETSKRRHSTDEGIHLTLSPTSRSITDEYGGTAVQTALSIQLRLGTSFEGGVASGRKSSRHDRRSSNVAVSSGSSWRDVAVQTDQVKIDFDESLIVQSPLSGMIVTPDISSPTPPTSTEDDVIMKAVHCENDHGSRMVEWDDVLNSNIARKSYQVSFPEDRTHLIEVTYCDFSEQVWQVAKNFAVSKSLAEKSSLSLNVCPPSKRMRKEEKSSGSVLTPKGRMMSSWNLLHEHRHSAIFLHPVTDRDAPGYSHVVHCPVDLTTMKREIDSGTIVNPNMMLRRVFMMFTNAVMFNSTGHDVNFYAREMCKDTIAECCFTMDPRMDAYRVHHRRSRTEDVRRRSTPTPTATSTRTLIRKRKY